MRGSARTFEVPVCPVYLYVAEGGVVAPAQHCHITAILLHSEHSPVHKHQHSQYKVKERRLDYVIATFMKHKGVGCY